MKETSIVLRDRLLRNTCRTLRGEKLQCPGRGCIDRLLCAGRYFLLLTVSLVEKRRRKEVKDGSKNNSRKQRQIRVEVFNRRWAEQVFAKSISDMNSSMNSCRFICIVYQSRKSKKLLIRLRKMLYTNETLSRTENDEVFLLETSHARLIFNILLQIPLKTPFSSLPKWSPVSSQRLKFY